MQTGNFFFGVPAPLTVAVVGPGTVTQGFAGTTERQIGQTYTITAHPQAGHHFAGWTDSVTSSAPTITFTMNDRFAVTASFQ